MMFDAGSGGSSPLAQAIQRRKKQDPFAFLKPIGDAASAAGAAVGNVIAEARKVPVVGGAMDALSAVGDATYKTPIGLAALGADAVLGTGLSAAAQRANAGRPWWELPKTATNTVSEAFGQVASDDAQTPLARAIAGLGRGAEQVGSFVAPIPGSAAALRLAGRGANALPAALESSVGRPAPGAGVFASRQGAPVTAGRRVPDATPDPVEAAKRQIAESLARQKANPTPKEELAVRYPVSKRDLDRMREKGQPVAGETPKADVADAAEDSLLKQLQDSIRARGVDPDTLAPLPKDIPPYTPKPPSEFVKASPVKTSIHDANEAAIAAAQKGDFDGVQAALDQVKAAGGSIKHTAKRLRDAGILRFTDGEVAGFAKKGEPEAPETMLRSAIRKRQNARVERPIWADDLESVGGKIEQDGTVIVYHATTADKAQSILKEGRLIRPANAPDNYGVYVSSSPRVADDYGDGTVVALRVPARDMKPDDLFPGRRLDFQIDTRGGEYRPIEVLRVERVRGESRAGPPSETPNDTTPPPTSGGGSVSSNVVPMSWARQKQLNKETIEQLNARIAEVRAREAARTAPKGGTPPPPADVPPTPPTTPTPVVPPSGFDKFLSAWNLPKAIKSSLDLSAPFRQGILLSAGHPREFFGAFKPMLQALRSDDFTKALDAEIRRVERPGLYLAPVDDAAGLAAREEVLMSNLAGKIPGVSASNRAYVTFLNKLRADVYDTVSDGWTKGGKSPTDADLRGLGDVINHFTGRGDIPMVSDRMAAALNGMFFSPRYVASRFQSVGDALGVIKSPSSLAAQEAASSMVKFVGAGLTVLGLAKLAGLKVEDDPRAASFGKIQVGPYQVDIWGGEQQVARYAAQFITGQRVIASGKNAGQVQDVARGGTASRFLRSKLAPTTGFANDVLGVIGGGGATAKDRRANAGRSITEQTIGRDFMGKPVTSGTAAMGLVAPLGPKTALESISKDDNKVRGTVIALLNMLGFGTNTFEDETAAAPSAPTTTPSGGTFRLTPPGAAPTSAPSSGTFRLTPPGGARSAQPSFRLMAPGGPKPAAPALMAPGGGAPPPPDDVRSTIQRVAQESGIDHRLALAVAQIESGFNPNAVGDTDTPYSSHGVFQERLRVGRGGFTTPDPDPARQTQRFAEDVKRLLASGFQGTPGQLAAAAQRPFDAAGYARKVDAAYQGFR